MLYKVAFWITCLLLVSTGAMAAPRASVRDVSQIGIVSKEMGTQECLAFDASAPQKITVSSRLWLGSPSSDTETDVTGAYRFEAMGKPRNRSRDIPVSPFSQDQAAVTSFAISIAGVGITDGLRENASPVARPVPANIRSVLPQPAAPPVIRKCQTPRPA